MLIESPANPRIRAAAALRERGERDRTGRTIVDGLRESERALEAGVPVETAFLCPSLLDETSARRIGDLLRERGIEVVDLSRRAFDRLAYGDRADGVVLVVRPPAVGLDRLRLDEREGGPLLVVTADVEKPGNLGAILRSADGAGADAVIAVGGTDLFNPNVIRASAGIVFSLPLATGSPAEALDWLRARAIRIVTARVDGAQLYTAADLRGPLAIVLGSEARGLSAAWDASDVESVRLPMLGVADSLNVAAAGAILLYEARRQRDPAAAS
jgi:RNA methyltransferase, TrmH family